MYFIVSSCQFSSLYVFLKKRESRDKIERETETEDTIQCVRFSLLSKKSPPQQLTSFQTLNITSHFSIPFSLTSLSPLIQEQEQESTDQERRGERTTHGVPKCSYTPSLTSHHISLISSSHFHIHNRTEQNIQIQTQHKKGKKQPG